MASKFGFILKLKEREGQHDALVQACQDIGAFVAKHHPGVITYSFSHDNNGNWMFVEIYENAEALAGKSNDPGFKPLLGGLFGLVVPVSCEFFGAAPEEVVNGLEKSFPDTRVFSSIGGHL